MTPERMAALERWAQSGPYNRGAVSAAVAELIEELDRRAVHCATAKTWAVLLVRELQARIAELEAAPFRVSRCNLCGATVMPMDDCPGCKLARLEAVEAAIAAYWAADCAFDAGEEDQARVVAAISAWLKHGARSGDGV